MITLLALLITLLLAGISAAAIFAVTQVTAKSELFRGTRNRILDYSLELTSTYLNLEALDSATWLRWVWTEFVGKVSDLVNCAFCQTFWHAIWITLGTAYLLGVPNGFAAAAWLPAIAMAKILHDKGTKRQIKRQILTDLPEPSYDHPLEELLKQPAKPVAKPGIDALKEAYARSENPNPIPAGWGDVPEAKTWEYERPVTSVEEFIKDTQAAKKAETAKTRRKTDSYEPSTDQTPHTGETTEIIKQTYKKDE